jgi:uncharacterized membrane protein
MESKASVARHPIHPMVVPLPIGLFTWTLIAGIVFFVNDNLMWYDIAFWSGIAGIGSALLAAVFGFIDYLSMPMRSRTRAIATVHMVVNLFVVALFFAATMMMIDRNAVSGTQQMIVLALHIAGVAALVVSGWLGGEMVYRHHVAVSPVPAAESEAARRRL